MKRIYTILILVCLPAILLLTGSCGLTGRDGKIDAIKLVTKDDAEKIFGTKMRLVSEETNEQASACVYSGAAADTDVYLQASFQIFPSEEHLKDAEEMAKTIKAKYGKIEIVEGIGDAAWLEASDVSQTLHVRRKNIAFLINATGGVNRAASPEEMRRVAETVASRL